MMKRRKKRRMVTKPPRMKDEMALLGISEETMNSMKRFFLKTSIILEKACSLEYPEHALFFYPSICICLTGPMPSNVEAAS